MKKIDKLPEVSSIPQTSLYSAGAVNIIENVRNRTVLHYGSAPSSEGGRSSIVSYKQGGDVMPIQYVSGLKTSKDTLKELVHTLEGLAYIDMLTGIPNRGALESFFDNSIKTSIRDSDCVTILLADIDEFKKVNDTYGHQTGDECLKNVARIMNEQKRSTDKLGRFGGEEFIYIMKHETVGDREIVAERLRRAVAENTNVTVSIGVHTIFPKELLPGKILSQKDIASVKTQAYDLADRALYQAKHNGKNRVEYFSSDDEEGLVSPGVQSSSSLLTIPTISDSASIHSESFVPGKVVQVVHPSHNLQEVI